jgi:hypothetical protein
MVLEKPKKWKDKLEGVLLLVEIVFIHGGNFVCEDGGKFSQW